MQIDFSHAVTFLHNHAENDDRGIVKAELFANNNNPDGSVGTEDVVGRRRRLEMRQCLHQAAFALSSHACSFQASFLRIDFEGEVLTQSERVAQSISLFVLELVSSGC